LPTIRELGGSVNTTAFVESNRAIAVSSIHVFIRLGPAFKVEDWYVRHNLGKKIHYGTGPSGPSPLAPFVAQAVKRVFEPLPSCLQFDCQV